MCTLVILHRPGDDWPIVLAVNRDEMADRPWEPPARHWPDRAWVVAGLDRHAGGTWLGLNDHGVVAGVLNRLHSLGPRPGFRSRGELPLEALDHARAADAAEALARIDAASYRSFNLLIADSDSAFWLRSAGRGNGTDGPSDVEVIELPPGLSMFTAYDRNDPQSARMRMYLPQFEAAPPPDPGAGDWSGWTSLLAGRLHDAEAGPGGAMNVATEAGFGTVSSSLIALPAAGRTGVGPVWLFAAGPPGDVPFDPVSL